MKKNNTNNVAILVLSCDKYADLWKPFFSQFTAYWRDCPFPVYLGSNTVKYFDSRVHTVLSGKSTDWSSDLIQILKKIDEEYIFIWLEDLFPTVQVETEKFRQCFQFMKTYDANHIHIAPSINPDGIMKDSVFGYYEKGSPYRVTLPGFWSKTQLQSLLIPGESPWNFEIMGSYRSSYSEGFYTLNIPLFKFIRVVDKGKISREAFDYCRKNNISLDYSRRKVFTRYEKIISSIRGYFFTIVLSIPWKKRVGLMNVMRKLTISY